MRRVKKKDHENLSDNNIRKVIQSLSKESPITKKEACEMLNIAYNTTRLDKIIAEYHERKAFVKLRKSQLRGRPASNSEISEIVTSYLNGESFAEISKTTYRSIAFCKSIVERVGVPSRVIEGDPWKADYLPENCVAEDFSEGEIAWSAKYHATCVVEAELSVDYQAEKLGYSDVNYEKKYGSKAYKIYVFTPTDEEDPFARRKPGFNAYSLAYDLGKLEHLKEYGINLETL